MATRLNVTKHRNAGAQVSIGSGQGIRAQGNPIPYLIPWATAVTILVAACVARPFVQRDSAWQWLWSIAVFAAGVALTVIAHRASRARGELVNTLAKWGVAAASAACLILIFVPAFPWRLLGGYLLATLVVCGGGNLYVAFKGNGDGNSTEIHDGVASAVKHIRNLNGTQVIDGSVVVEGRMQPGVPAADLTGATNSLASMYGVGANGVKIEQDKNDAGKFKMRVSPVDYLSTPPPYTGPSIRDGSGPFGHGTIMDPIGLGRRLGGQPLQLWLPGDPKQDRNASLIQLTGMSGAGKSICIRCLLIDLMSRGMPDEVEYWYLNSRKADQEPDWVRRGAARFESKRDGVIQALRDLRDEMPDRAAHLGGRGLDQWQPGCGIPFRLVVADEFADVAPDVERMLVDLSETLRSLGEIMACGFQRATGDRFPTSARSNFGTHICFGVKDEVDAGMALPDEVLDAGAKPWIWGNKMPGYCYLTAPGVPEELWNDEARTFKPNAKLMEQWAVHFINLRERGPAAAVPVPASGTSVAVPDDEDTDMAPTSVNTAGDGVPDSDEAALAAMFGDGTDDTALARTDDDEDGFGWNDDQDDQDDDGFGFDDEDTPEGLIRDVIEEDGGRGDVDDLEEERRLRPKVPADLADVWRVNHREPIEVEGGGMQLRLAPKMTDDQARTFLRSYIAQLRAQGVTGFKVVDVGEDILHATGMKSSWLSKWLGRLCGGPVPMLAKRGGARSGEYDILPAPAIGDGS